MDHACITDWIFCLQNERRRQAGISFILVDMSSPGVSVHPIITADRSHEVNSVTFTTSGAGETSRRGGE